MIVVGAGPAGLGAAHQLSRRGANVRVLEQRASVGGRAGCDRVGDWSFDRGAEFLASFYSRALSLVREAGIRKRMVRVPMRGDVVIDGRRAVLPMSFWQILRSPLLSGRTKRRLCSFGFRSMKWRSRLRWSRLVDGAFLDDETAQAYFERAIGSDYVECVLRPTLESLVLSPISETSRVVPLSQAREALGARLLCPRGGLGVLWEALARELEVSCGETVTAVVREGDGVVVERANGEALRADAAVVAVTPFALRRIVAEPIGERAAAEKARYSPVVKVHLCLDRPFPREVPLCPGGSGSHPVAGVGILEAKGTGQCPEGRGGLVLCASASLSAELLEMDDRAVVRRMLDESRHLLGADAPAAATAFSVVRLREAVPLFYVGWVRQLQALQESLGPAPIAAAGDWLGSPSIEGALASAQHAAQRIAQWLLGRRQ